MPALTGREAPQDLRRGRHADVVLGEVDARFEQRDQFQQLLLQRCDAARYRAAGLLRRDARLVERRGVDQIAHGFGLRQVDAAVQKRAQSELAGFGQPRAGVDGPLHRVPQHHGRAMAGNLDHVLRGVGARAGKKAATTWSTACPSESHSSASWQDHGRQSGGPANRSILEAISFARGPDSRTTPSPARPAGVEIATMVSVRFNYRRGPPRAPRRCGRPPLSGPPRSRPPPESRRPPSKGPSRRTKAGCGGSGRLAMPAG